MMQIVIEMPEEYYKALFSSSHVYLTMGGRGNGKTLVSTVLVAVAKGIPLPKGHGRLIDADALEYTCNSDECGMLTGCDNCQYHIITEWELDRAPTIIEADREVDE